MGNFIDLDSKPEPVQDFGGFQDAKPQTPDDFGGF